MHERKEERRERERGKCEREGEGVRGKRKA